MAPHGVLVKITGPQQGATAPLAQSSAGLGTPAVPESWDAGAIQEEGRGDREMGGGLPPASLRVPLSPRLPTCSALHSLQTFRQRRHRDRCFISSHRIHIQ